MLDAFHHDYFAETSKIIAANFRVFDTIGLFKSMANSFSSDGIEFNTKAITVYLYTFLEQSKLLEKYNNIPVSENDIVIFFLENGDDIIVSTKLSKSLFSVSRFETAYASKEYKKIIRKSELVKKELSPQFLLSLLVENGEPLLNPLNVAGAKVKCPMYSKVSAAGNKSNEIAVVNDKEKLNITIGVFFDGTSNNRYCSELIYYQNLSKTKNSDGELNEEELKKKNLKLAFHPKNKGLAIDYVEELIDFDYGCSYLNSYTNVVLLHDLYATIDFNKENPSSEIIIKQYVQGVGTQVDLDEKGCPIKFNPDDSIDRAFGRGDNGVIGKYEKSVQDIIDQIQKIVEQSQMEIGTITFDLFGFSRGAATASYFANQILRKQESQKTVSNGFEVIVIPAIPANGYFGQVLEQKKLKIPEKVEIRLIGLFDTVVETWLIDKSVFSLKEYKGKVIHIIALDEYRYNFPLAKSEAPNTFELYLYGSHSDIGGGYSNQIYNTVVDFEDSQSVEISNPKELLNLKKELNYLSKKFAMQLNNKGKVSVNEKQIQIIKGEIDHKNNSQENSDSFIKYHFKLTDNRYISNKLQLVSLNAMLEYAVLNKVPFRFEKSKTGEILPMDKSQISLYKFPNDNSYFKYNEEVQKLIILNNNKESYFDREVYFPLYNKYIHLSANYNISYGIPPKRGYEEWSDLQYVNRPTKDRKRVGLDIERCMPK
jgi:hypothetical protein